MASEYTLIVAPRVQDRIDDHGHWWRKNRKASRVSFGKALVAGYSRIKSAPKLGVQHEIEADFEVWTTQLETGHILYFRLVYKPPLPTYIRVIGIKGPSEAKPFFG